MGSETALIRLTWQLSVLASIRVFVANLGGPITPHSAPRSSAAGRPCYWLRAVAASASRRAANAVALAFTTLFVGASAIAV